MCIYAGNVDINTYLHIYTHIYTYLHISTHIYTLPPVSVSRRGWCRCHGSAVTRDRWVTAWQVTECGRQGGYFLSQCWLTLTLSIIAYSLKRTNAKISQSRIRPLPGTSLPTIALSHLRIYTVTTMLTRRLNMVSIHKIGTLVGSSPWFWNLHEPSFPPLLSMQSCSTKTCWRSNIVTQDVRCVDYYKIQTMKAVNFTLIHSFNTPPPCTCPPPGGWNVPGVVVAIRWSCPAELPGPVPPNLCTAAPPPAQLPVQPSPSTYHMSGLTRANHWLA